MSESTLTGSVDFFRRFAEYYAAGLTERIEGEVAAGAPETESTSRSYLATELASGALLARARWGVADQEQPGCLLWTGDLGVLLGGDPKTVADLDEEEIQTLDASLHLNVEEGGEDLEFSWDDLERVSGDALGEALAALGVADETERARVTVTVAEREVVFHFLASAKIPAEAIEEAPVPEPAEPDEEASAPPIDSAGSSGLRNLGHLLSVKLPLTIRLGSTRMSLEEVFRLTPGAIVELDRREEEPLDVLANGQVVARGEVVVVDERFGLRITEIGSSAERLRASL